MVERFADHELIADVRAELFARRHRSKACHLDAADVRARPLVDDEANVHRFRRVGRALPRQHLGADRARVEEAVRAVVGFDALAVDLDGEWIEVALAQPQPARLLRGEPPGQASEAHRAYSLEVDPANPGSSVRLLGRAAARERQDGEKRGAHARRGSKSSAAATRAALDRPRALRG